MKYKWKNVNTLSERWKQCFVKREVGNNNPKEKEYDILDFIKIRN